MELVRWSNGDVEGADDLNFFEKMLYQLLTTSKMGGRWCDDDDDDVANSPAPTEGKS